MDTPYGRKPETEKENLREVIAIFLLTFYCYRHALCKQLLSGEYSKMPHAKMKIPIQSDLNTNEKF
jgi:hypothetical protein